MFNQFVIITQYVGHYLKFQKTYATIAHKYQVPYYEDSSNSDNKYVRNDIRNRLLPTINQNADLDSTHLLKLKRWHDIQLQESRKSPILYRE